MNTSPGREVSGEAAEAHQRALAEHELRVESALGREPSPTRVELRALLRECPLCLAEYDELLRLEGRLAQAGADSRRWIAEAEVEASPEQRRMVARVLREQVAQVAPLRHMPRGLLAAASFALLATLGSVLWWRANRAAAEREFLLGGDFEIHCTEASEGALSFGWDRELSPGGWFEVRLRELEGAQRVLLEPEPIEAQTWTVPASERAHLSRAFSLEVTARDAAGTRVAQAVLRHSP